MYSSTNLEAPARVLAISAHPDDSELQAGATLAKWAAAGAVVDLFVCTDGSKGTWKPEVAPEALVATREAEQATALELLGSSGTAHFGRWVDGELESGLDQRSVVARVIRQSRPDVVIGHDPWKRYRLHPDHRHAGLLAVEGIVAARDPHFFPEHGLAPHRPSVLLLHEADEADHLETVSRAHLDAKLASLEAHVSQLESTMFIDDDDDGAQRAAFRQRILDAAAVAVDPTANPQPEVYGEAFKKMDDL